MPGGAKWTPARRVASLVPIARNSAEIRRIVGAGGSTRHGQICCLHLDLRHKCLINVGRWICRSARDLWSRHRDSSSAPRKPPEVHRQKVISGRSSQFHTTLSDNYLYTTSLSDYGVSADRPHRSASDRTAVLRPVTTVTMIRVPPLADTPGPAVDPNPVRTTHAASHAAARQEGYPV